jgi:long-chain acyl-CoA synthetase
MVSSLVDLGNDRPALIAGGSSRSFGELNDRSNRLLAGLRSLGIGPGDRIAVLTGNTPEFFEVAVAAGHGGITYVPVNSHWTASEIAYVLDDAEVAALVLDDALREAGAAAVGMAHLAADRVIATGADPGPFRSYDALLAACSGDEPENETAGFYTSGTTGRPKGVRTVGAGEGRAPVAWGRVGPAIAAAFRMPVGGVQLLCGPAYHTAQWSWTVPLLFAGNTVVIHETFDAERVLRDIDAHGVTGTHLVPTQLVRLLRADPEVRSAFDGSSLAAVWHGAAPCPPEVKRRMIEWWGPIIWEYYGGTEGGVLSSVSSADWLARPGTVGRVAAGYEVRVTDDDGNDVPPGESGVIWFRRSSGAQFEYHNAPEKTAASRRDGYATLGDVGRFDADGFLYLSDRAIDLIISGGVNIYPAEVEHCLMAHDAVVDVAVFGVADPEFGEQVKAVVELAPGVEPGAEVIARLDAHARGLIAGYKVPRSYEFVDAVPRLESGKALKRELRERYSSAAVG